MLIGLDNYFYKGIEYVGVGDGLFWWRYAKIALSYSANNYGSYHNYYYKQETSMIAEALHCSIY